MKEVLAFVSVIVALIIGAFAGYLYEVLRSAAANVLVETTKTYRTLRDLRSGNTNAVFKTLEEDLDVNVIFLRGILDEHPHAKYAKSYTNILSRIAQYRSTHPYHNVDTHIDEMVTRALNSVSNMPSNALPQQAR